MQDVFTTIVQPGFPRQVAQVDLVAQQANIANTNIIYTVPKGQAGLYRLSVYNVLTQAATVSSTMPAVDCKFTDDSGITQNNQIVGGAGTGNTVGINSGAGANTWAAQFFAAEGSNIILYTSGYASSGATPMQYSLRARLEYLG